jgi:CRP-like cAMP-binding protein
VIKQLVPGFVPRCFDSAVAGFHPCRAAEAASNPRVLRPPQNDAQLVTNGDKEETVVELDDLKSVVMFSSLKDAMLKKIAPVTLVTEFSAGSYIFKEGDYAKYLYAVIDGKVGLELEKSSGNSIMMDTVIRGRSLGFSALVDTELRQYTTHARALTDVKLFAWEAAELEKLFYQDYEFGFLFMKSIARIAKNRLQVRNLQFLDIYH